MSSDLEMKDEEKQMATMPTPSILTLDENPLLEPLEPEPPSNDFKIIVPNEEGTPNTFVVSRRAAQISAYFQAFLEDANTNEVTLPDNAISTMKFVAPYLMEQVVAYMKHHDGTEGPKIEKPLRSKDLRDKSVCADPFDADLIIAVSDSQPGTRQPLYDFVLLANYLGIPNLTELGCARIAALMRGHPLEKVEAILRGEHSGDID
jgi:hypothetical protein